MHFVSVGYWFRIFIAGKIEISSLDWHHYKTELEFFPLLDIMKTSFRMRNIKVKLTKKEGECCSIELAGYNYFFF